MATKLWIQRTQKFTSHTHTYTPTHIGNMCCGHVLLDLVGRLEAIATNSNHKPHRTDHKKSDNRWKRSILKKQFKSETDKTTKKPDRYYVNKDSVLTAFNYHSNHTTKTTPSSSSTKLHIAFIHHWYRESNHFVQRSAAFCLYSLHFHYRIVESTIIFTKIGSPDNQPIQHHSHTHTHQHTHIVAVANILFDQLHQHTQQHTNTKTYRKYATKQYYAAYRSCD